MRHVSNFAQSRFAFWFAMGVALLPGIAGAWLGLSYLQQQYVPIVDRFVVTELQIDDSGDVTLAGNFYKLYPDWLCHYKQMRWYMLAEDAQGHEYKLRIKGTYRDNRAVNYENNRFSGYNEFAGWTLHTSEYPNLTALEGAVDHKCWIFPTRTILTRLNI